MNTLRRVQAWWAVSRHWWDKAETWTDDMIGYVPTAVFPVTSVVVVVLVVALLLSSRLPDQGASSPPNLIFLSFVVVFGFMGMSSKVKTRVWAALGLAVGLIVWGLSVRFA